MSKNEVLTIEEIYIRPDYFMAAVDGSPPQIGLTASVKLAANGSLYLRLSPDAARDIVALVIRDTVLHAQAIASRLAAQPPQLISNDDNVKGK